MYKQYVLDAIKSTVNAETVSSFVEHNISDPIKFNISVFKGFDSMIVVSVDIKDSQLASDIDDKLKENSLKYENVKFKGKTEKLMFTFGTVRNLEVRGKQTLTMLADSSSDEYRIGVGVNEYNVHINHHGELNYSYIKSNSAFQALLPSLIKILDNSNDINGSLGVQSIELLDPTFNIDPYSTVFLRNKKPSIKIKGDKDKGFSGTTTAELYVYDGEYLDSIKHTVAFKIDGNMIMELNHKSATDFSQLCEVNDALSCIEKLFFNIISSELSRKHNATVLSFFAS